MDRGGAAGEWGSRLATSNAVRHGGRRDRPGTSDFRRVAVRRPLCIVRLARSTCCFVLEEFLKLTFIRTGVALAALLSSAGCGKNMGVGDAATGGTPGTAGRQGTGGVPGTGGVAGTGGDSGSGGRTASGGRSGSGGQVGAGGSGSGGRVQSGGSGGGAGAGGGTIDAGTDRAGTPTDGGTSDGPTCPRDIPRSAASPGLSQACSIALTTLTGCTYSSTLPDAAACFETFVCTCISDQMGGVDCRWQSQGPDCAGPFDTCNPLSGAAVICGGAALSCLSCPSAPNANDHYCSTPCTNDWECPDPRRPKCSRPSAVDGGVSRGLCTPRDRTCSS